MNSVKIGICGLGTVGSGTVNVLGRNGAEINARAGCNIVVAQVGARRDNPHCELGGIAVTRDIFEVAENPEIDILVELIGGTSVAKDLVLKAIENGKHVVTANKALIAEFGNEIFSAAKEKGVTVAFEAAVACRLTVSNGLPALLMELVTLSLPRCETRVVTLPTS